MELRDFDPSACVRAMRTVGVASLPSFIRDVDRANLLQELATYEPVQARGVAGPYKVRQDYVHVRVFREGSLFLTLQERLSDFLGARLAKYFSSRLIFNDLVTQTYAPGSVGITPHKDGECFRNVVALLVLEGSGEFGVCRDRAGNGFRAVENSPGTLLLMRAPGFLHTNVQPFHTLRTITTKRTTVGLRQRRIK